MKLRDMRGLEKVGQVWNTASCKNLLLRSGIEGSRSQEAPGREAEA